MMKVQEMKRPNPSKETFEFNLGRAKNLRCVHHQQNTICGECESCLLTSHLNHVKQWFFRAGDHSQRRFVLGLVRRLHSLDLLRQLVNLLQPLMCKDYMYARSRTSPSLKTDRSSMSSDRALSTSDLENKIATVWYWFQTTTYWTKWNFVLGILQECQVHLLNAVGTQARTLLSSEEKAFIPPAQYECSSIASTKHSFDSEHHPELDLLTTAHSEYSGIRQDPFMDGCESEGKATSDNLSEPHSPADSRSWDGRRASLISYDAGRQTSSSKLMETVYEDKELVNEDSDDDDGFGDTVIDMDPACMVIPTSVKAHSGVARYKDFIRHLPVHLSKMILGMLDQVTLNNVILVNKIWRNLGEQVHKEFFVQQQLWEEVMLMQGAAAQACNPLYALDIDVAVPNVEPDTFSAIRTDEDFIEPAYKSEASFRTAYTGYSTRNIIMEERNVYCGAYNVMVLLDQGDPHRVIHTAGGELIGLGSQDRRLRFINSETGKETGLVISGHAGSIRCLIVNEKKGYVLSGSYDTSIRCWSLETGKCQRIFRGHRDTITCLQIRDGMLVSGAKDHMCKVWMIATGKCIRTFKHRHAVMAVGLSEDICISGCEGGKVKVWDMKTGSLIKKLSGHHEPVTAIKFDKWHIISASKDGYALAWSAQGNHKRCLTAFRHPKAVLCIEFMYLRVITGSADGKIRIWNMISGQCLRIMRGNSRSDPINTLVAIDNRITINTANTLLVLNFEPVEYDYTLEDDSMPPMVQYSHYSNAPVRPQPYAYIRAQRMSKAGASNMKIVKHDCGDAVSECSRISHRPSQIPHSAKTLSKASMIQARRIQSAKSQEKRPLSRALSADEAVKYVCQEKHSSARPNTAPTSLKSVNMPMSAANGKPPCGTQRPTTSKSRLTSANSRTPSQSGMVSSAGFALGRGDDDSDITAEEGEDALRRRVSWAFEHPLLPGAKPLDLKDTKTLLRSQIRSRGEVMPPDFIYLAVNAIQNKMKPAHVTKDLDPISCEEEVERFRQPGRPTSSPSRFDAKTKVPVQDLRLDDFRIEDGIEPDVRSVIESKTSKSGSQRPQVITGPPMPVPTTIVTGFQVTPVSTKPFPLSLYPAEVPTSIPKACVIRPHTASKVPLKTGQEVFFKEEQRPKSAIYQSRPGTAKSAITTVSSTRGAGGKQSTGLTSSNTDPCIVPMLMYSKDVKGKLEELKRKRAEKFSHGHSQASDTARIGNVSEYNGPLRNHVEFKLLTHDQVEKQIENITKSYERQRKDVTVDVGKKQRCAWLAKVKKQRENDIAAIHRPRSAGVVKMK